MVEPLSRSPEEAGPAPPLPLRRRAASLEGLPAVLTVEEAAAVLRIGRGAAYELARRFRETGGRDGLPVVAFGRTLRVPRAALARLLDPAEGGEGGDAA